MGAHPPKPTTARAPRVNRRWLAADELIDEITRTAERIGAARTWHDEPVFRTTGPWRVLTTVAHSKYCLSISDLARALGVRKQVAHALAHQAERAAYVELVPNHQIVASCKPWSRRAVAPSSRRSAAPRGPGSSCS